MNDDKQKNETEPIPIMDYNKVENILATSKKEDWISNDELGTFTYKKDLNLHINRSPDDREFNEPWAKNFPDKNARAVDYKVFYNNSFVDEKMLISVDGARAVLPLPKSPDVLTVKKENVNFASIVDTGNQFSNYMERSGLKEEE